MAGLDELLRFVITLSPMQHAPKLFFVSQKYSKKHEITVNRLKFLNKSRNICGI
jgi:hypothetical protein